MLKALGLQFKKEDGTLISEGVSSLLDLALIDASQLDARLNETQFIIACDVDNPLIGDCGATAIFGPQKGVKEHQIAYFDSCLKRFADIIEKQFSIRLHDFKGAGAAGGMGGALVAFLNGSFHAGIDIVIDAVQLKKHLEGADFVITGEGKSDCQTLHGKAPLGVAKVAKLANAQAILLSGAIDEIDKPALLNYFNVVESLVDEKISVQQAMQKPYEFIRLKTKRIFEYYVQMGDE